MTTTQGATPVQTRQRILVIDDNDAIHADFRKTLEQRSQTERLAAAASLLFDVPAPKAHGKPAFDVVAALQGQEGYEKLKEAMREGRPYAMAFVDMRMPPGWDGIETVQNLWKADPELQVVICTAYSDYSWDQIVSKLGATDRLLILKKPFDPMEVCQLATALTEKWKLKRQATLKLEELERMVHERTAELRRIALTDKLTDLPNRAALSELLRKSAAALAAGEGPPFAVHFIDFDRFKAVNDTLGHEVGDQLLVSIANRFCQLLNQHPGDDFAQRQIVAARLGGDEFVVLQRGVTHPKQALAFSEELLRTLEPTHLLGVHEIQSTASIGIAISDPHAAPGADLLRDADCAMYRAKSLGKGRAVLFASAMYEKEVTRLTLESDLRQTWNTGALFLCYQPIICLTEARLMGFEALLRWRHPTRGLISPAEFIPLAEESGLILPIGQWVLETAMRQLADWSARIPGAQDLSISVNCSRKQLADPQFAKQVKETLTATGIDPRRLNLEITESVMMEGLDNTCSLLQELRSLGAGLHMDDFGTGYSSLSLLHRLPHTVLKIDRSFVNSMSERREYAAIVDAIVALAHNLGMKVVAEGVETADHAAMLCALECDCAQGFFFAKPLSASDAESYILKGKPIPQVCAGI